MSNIPILLFIVVECQFQNTHYKNYVENLEEFKNTTVAEDNKKVNSVEFNKWIVYLLIANSGRLKYASLENGLASQYSMKNNQYPKDLISSADMMKNNRKMILEQENRTQDIKTQNFKKNTNSGKKEEKVT